MKTKKRSVLDPALVGLLREQVRVAISALPPTPGKVKKASVRVISAGIKAMGFNFDDDHLDAAIEWNHKRNLIDFEYDHTYQREEWFLTEKGDRCA